MATPVIVRSQQALGQELARLRFDRGLTQAELAERLGVSRRYLYELESGKPNLFASRLFELLRELGAHLDVVALDEAVPPASPPVTSRPSAGGPAEAEHR